MPTRTISLDEEAYERLRAHKQEGESFSDVVKWLAGERSWSEVAGILTDEEADALEDAVAAGRTRSAERADRVADELTGATDDR
jgi:predicted CopG family antitoxin